VVRAVVEVMKPWWAFLLVPKLSEPHNVRCYVEDSGGLGSFQGPCIRWQHHLQGLFRRVTQTLVGAFVGAFVGALVGASSASLGSVSDHPAVVQARDSQFTLQKHSRLLFIAVALRGPLLALLLAPLSGLA
jgi:hypothetical protein